MKLFTVGPVEMYRDTLEIAGTQLPYFRTPEFSKLMLENERMLKQTVHAPEETKTVFLTASGTAAMEAAVINCFEPIDRLLVINGGGFGQRFCDICRIHKIPYTAVEVPFGQELTEELLAPFEKGGYAGLLVNLHETSTGQLYSLPMLSAFCERNGMYLVVDAISAYGADEIDFEQYGIDVLILSSQKALALSPGLSMVLVSRRMYDERVSTVESGCLYLDFKEHINDMTRGQTPFTPAVGVLLELHQRLEQILEQGMEQMIAETACLAKMFRNALKEAGYEIPRYPLSNALTPVYLNPHAKAVYEALKNHYGLVVTPSGGTLADTLIRVGHLGDVHKGDYQQLLAAMQEIRERI